MQYTPFASDPNKSELIENQDGVVKYTLVKNYGDFKYMYKYVRDTELILQNAVLPLLPVKRNMAGVKLSGNELQTDLEVWLNKMIAIPEV